MCVLSSAGVGRSGTFITLDAMLDQMKNENVVDVHAYITHIRMQRNYMVQTEVTYYIIKLCKIYCMLRNCAKA